MSFSLDLKISGVKEAGDALKAFSEDVLDGTRFALEDVGQMLVDEMQNTVPIDTGNLRDSIHAEMDGEDLNVSADAEYAGFVEYGTWKMEPHPFFAPAITKVRQGLGLEEVADDAISNWERTAASQKHY